MSHWCLTLVRVYLGINPATDSLAAVKVINLTTPAAGRPSRKELEKEVKVHRMMKHQYVLEFIDAVLVEEGSDYVPGLFMLLEYAQMGDLFDKIGQYKQFTLQERYGTQPSLTWKPQATEKERGLGGLATQPGGEGRVELASSSSTSLPSDRMHTHDSS